MIDQRPNEIILKPLPQSNVIRQLFELFPSTQSGLDALASALNEDRSRAYLSRTVRGEKETFVLSTPRHRIRFFEDRHDAAVAVVLSAEANSYFQWVEDKKRGVPCSALWTARTPFRIAASENAYFDALRSSKAGGVASARYWEFWSNLLDQEQKKLEELKNHPGWAYSARRPSMSGGVEFQVGDDRDSILRVCGSSFLVQAEGHGKRTTTRIVAHLTEIWTCCTSVRARAC